jgi:hypothetical protein
MTTAATDEFPKASIPPTSDGQQKYDVRDATTTVGCAMPSCAVQKPSTV